jgi:hypothetical protein
MYLNNKPKLLWVGDDYRLKTGYGRVARELFFHLNKNYTIINYSIGCIGISSEYHIIDSKDGTSFGFIKLPLVIDTIKPNIIILLNDSKIVYGWLQSIQKSRHNCTIIPYVCTEYIGIPECEIQLYNEITHGLLAMANFTINEFVKNGYIHKTLRLSHGYTKNILPMNKNIAKKMLGISHDTFVFFSGNKNQPRKRLDIIVRAFVHFLKNHNNEKVLLMMNCGLIDSGWNLKELYIRLCKENNIINMENHIYFCSFNVNDSNKNDEELTLIYNACDVGITTSTGESFGLIPFEQSALGVPQIIPNWGGIIEAIKFGCITVEPNDYYVYPVILQSSNGEARTVYYKDVMAAMEQYYTDTILYNSHTIEVKKNIENFDWASICNELITFIEPFMSNTIEPTNIKSNNLSVANSINTIHNSIDYTPPNCFMKKCIFICVFNQEKYIDMFYLLLESIFTYGNLDDNTDIVVYTSTPFMNKIKQSHLFNDNKIKFEINDTYDNIDKACKARLDLFNLHSITNYTKILYLDTDILVKDDINNVFNVCEKDILYVLEEGSLEEQVTFWGRTLFSNDEINKYEDKTTFTSGILLFNNCEKIKDLFIKIKEDIIHRPYNFCCYDQPYIVYNAFKYNLYNNKILNSIAVNKDTNIHSNKVIHHFPSEAGGYQHKIEVMTIFFNSLKNQYRLFIEKILSGSFTLVNRERLINLYNQCSKFKYSNYSFVECGVGKGGCLSMMKYASGKNNKIFGFDSFEGMPNITKEDLGEYNKSNPLIDFGKVGDNLSGGINNVYNTFNKLELNMNNVTLVKGFFQDTLQIQENIDNIGGIAVLRLDGDWYNSTKICLEKLYDKVIDGGVIIIDDYGHFIGAKRATDEFRIKHKILTPLIKTDYSEYFWIKNKNIDEILSNSLSIEDDIWTCSRQMRYDIYDFFKDKTHLKIAEIGSHKGYSTKVLSKIFSKIYAVDNNIEWTNFNKNFNKDAKNIEYVMLDIYKDGWDVLPDDIEVSFIDADHSYNGCKSDIFNSIKYFKSLKYIIFDDYGVWPGVKQIIDELINKHVLKFERFIGINDVPSLNGIIKNVNEGVICSINKILS